MKALKELYWALYDLYLYLFPDPAAKVHLEKVFLTMIVYSGKMLPGWKMANSFTERHYIVVKTNKNSYTLYQSDPWGVSSTVIEHIITGTKKDVMYQIKVLDIDTML